MDEPKTLRTLFGEAEAGRKKLESSPYVTSSEVQEALAATLKAYAQCLDLVDRASLFSRNETLDDISSGDLQYLLINFHVGQLTLLSTAARRDTILKTAQKEYEQYLRLLDSYEIVSREDAKLHERYFDNPEQFSTASQTDAAARRNTKIARYKEEKELKRTLELHQKSPEILQGDDSALRKLHLTHITLCTHHTFQSLESIAQELQILSLAPPTPPNGTPSQQDSRERQTKQDSYSERLDPPLSQLTDRNGPILSKDGRPLRPFTLLDSRQRLQKGVFRPDHNLPTMSIDEYLEEEKRRGGIIEGGGPQSEYRPEPNEDDLEKADAETMKARAWDDFKDDNPKGAGNTMNMG